MGLGDLDKPAELWSVVKNKEGKEFPGILRCNSIKQLEEDEPTLAEDLNNAFQKWYKETGKEEAEKLLTTFGKDGGYSYKHADGNTYKFVKFNGQLQLSKMKGGGWSGKKGGTYTFMRTEAVVLGHVDVVNQTITSQGPTDSWKITKVAGEAMKDMIFLMEKQAQYTPASSATTETKKDAAKEASQEDTEE